MNVPFLELKPAYLEFKEELDAAYHRVMDSGWYLLGAELESFEDEFATYCDVKHCVAVGSGLDALHLILRAYDIGAGDEVLVPSNTFIATWLAVSHAGAVPVPVEPDPHTFNLDPERIAAAITPRTRAIIPVHLYGQPADMDPILAIARRHGLKVIEDNAQAQGACYKGAEPVPWVTRRRTVFIRQKSRRFCRCRGGDHVGCGRGGSCPCPAQLRIQGKILQRSQRFQLAHGRTASRVSAGEVGETGCLEQSPPRPGHALPEGIEQRGRPDFAVCARMGRTGLASLCGPAFPTQRVADETGAAGIGTLIHYPVPPHRSGAYAGGKWRRNAFTIAENLADTVLSLPMGPHLAEEQVSHVIREMNRSLPALEERNGRQISRLSSRHVAGKGA